nr:MAG: RNA-dependent RNA polymerase [brine shrimp partiti-like virus 3]
MVRQIAETTKLASNYLKYLGRDVGFAGQYAPSILDRDALFALNRTFDRDKITEVKEKYHRASVTADTLKEDLFEYGCKKSKRINDPIYYTVLESVRRDLKPNELIIPLTTGAVVNHPNYPSTRSAGLPFKTQPNYPTSKGAVVKIPGVVDGIRQKWHDIGRGVNRELEDCCCFARAQISSRQKNKIRATWGYPLEVYLEEGRFFYPMLENLKNKEQPKIAYGLEIATGGMGYINDMARRNRGNYLMGDWRRFDKTVSAWIIRDAFSLLYEWIDFGRVIDSEGKIWNVRKDRSIRRFKRLVSYFINTPVRFSDGERYMKIGGVPSGSCFTNIVDSIINMIVMRYCIYQLSGSFPTDDVYLGDDSVVCTKNSIDLEAFATYAEEKFSMKLNTDKTYQTKNSVNIHFLGYYNMDGKPYKPIDTVIASSIYPEKPTATKEETVVRLIGQAYSCFEPSQSAKFFMAADKLIKEENWGRDYISEWLHQFYYQAKFLQSLGYTAADVRVPNIEDLAFGVVPTPCRRQYKPPDRNWSEIYASATANWVDSSYLDESCDSGIGSSDESEAY